METHAHHLHHAPGKNAWHYFYEFLMLFLAVSCGFLAENLRERNVEHSREKEYMESLVEDLRQDTAQFSRIRIFRLNRLKEIDSISGFFETNLPGPVPAYGYPLAKKLFGHAAFFQNNGTLDQLKNAGGLRLIRHRNVVDSIQAYEQQIRRIELRDIYETDFSFAHNALQQKLFNGSDVLKHILNTGALREPGSTSTRIRLNRQYVDEYLNSLMTFRSFITNALALQEAVKERATRLIFLVSKEYHLEIMDL